MRRPGRPPHPDILTPRQWEVLELLRHRMSDQAIADELGLTLAGAKYHVSEILTKLAVSSREEAAAWEPPPKPATRWTRLALPLAGAALVTSALVGIGVLAWGVSETDDGSSSSIAVDQEPHTTVTVPADGSFRFVIPEPDPLLNDPSVYNVPRLTTDQVAEASRIAEADSLVWQIVSQTEYSFDGVGPWLEDDELVGLGVTVKLAAPQTIEATWPFLQRDDDGNVIRDPNGHKARREHYHTVNELERIQFLIDFEEDRVAVARILDYASVTTPSP